MYARYYWAMAPPLGPVSNTNVSRWMWEMTPSKSVAEKVQILPNLAFLLRLTPKILKINAYPPVEVFLDQRKGIDTMELYRQ